MNSKELHTQAPACQTSAPAFCQEVQRQDPCALLAPLQWQSASKAHHRKNLHKKSGSMICNSQEYFAPENVK